MDYTKRSQSIFNVRHIYGNLHSMALKGNKKNLRLANDLGFLCSIIAFIEFLKEKYWVCGIQISFEPKSDCV